MVDQRTPVVPSSFLASERPPGSYPQAAVAGSNQVVLSRYPAGESGSIDGGRAMLDPDDRGPGWLSDYGFTNFGDIAADIQAMREFAKKLETDLMQNYVPHMDRVGEAMVTKLPPPAGTFNELCTFIETHRKAQDATHNNVYSFANGTNRFATAAKTISDEYEGSDAFARAKVGDVERAFKVADAPEGTYDA